MIKLSTWAKQNNVCYKTAWNWVVEGKFPLRTFVSKTNRIFVIDDDVDNPKTDETTILYCRVSNHSRRKELDYQVDRCKMFALSKGWSVTKIYKEVASGMNDNRTELWKAIDNKPTRILIENKDRLTRFGFNYLKRLLQRQGTEIVVINESEEDKEDLIKDLCAIIYSFCARLYGMRRAKNKADKVKEIINNEE